MRQAAAQSLGAFAKLGTSTLSALLAALEDADEAVQLAALQTLASALGRLDSAAPEHKALLAALKKRSMAKHLSDTVRFAIKVLLKDQAPLARPFGAGG